MPLTFRETSTGREITVEEPGDPPVRGEAARARRIARFDASPDWERAAQDTAIPADDPDSDDEPSEPAAAEHPPAPAAKDVRAWARAESIEVPSRGPIPDDVIDRYEAAHEPTDG